MRDLFGHERAKTADPFSKVSLRLQHHEHRDTTKAVFLSLRGGEAGGKHAPRREVTEGVGPDAGVWTMPRWLAAEKGWL